MGKKATKTATAQLQRIFDFLGEFGGVIKTNEPEIWWDLDVEVEQADDESKEIVIGVCSMLNGDLMYDPQFRLTLKMEDKKIVQAVIVNYYSETVLGFYKIDENDNIYGMGSVEKDTYGLRKRFSSFMDNMTEIGPYLTEPKTVKKFDKTLAEF